jgi:hypothetical protein
LNKPLFSNLFGFFIGLTYLSFAKPIMLKIIKYNIGFLMSAVGIALNEILSGIHLLKSFSDSILYLIPFDTNGFIQAVKGYFKSPNLSISTLKNVDQKIISDAKIVNDSGSLLSVIGLLILGAGVVLAVIITGDYLAPSTIR